jgi:hypothetical protein
MRGGGAGGFATMIGIPVEMVAIGVVEVEGILTLVSVCSDTI